MSSPLLSDLQVRLRGRLAVVGIGNPDRGDDGVGSAVVRRLLALPDAAAQPGLTLIDAEEVPESWAGRIAAASPDVVLLIDAVELGAEPGSVAILEPAELTGRAICTHRTPLGPFCAFIAHETGADILLLGIQPGAERWGPALSPAVGDSADAVARLLADLLGLATGKEAVPC
jgi:hydrogenase 3 maturation protease